MFTHRSTRTAFTLIELMLVVSLLVIISGFAVMVLQGSLLRSKLTKSIDQVRTDWTEAHRQSVEGGYRIAFTCLIGTNEYRLTSVDSVLSSAEQSAEDIGNASESHELPNDVKFASVVACPCNTVGQTTTPISDDEGSWSAPVVFNPDGTSYDAVLVFELSNGKRQQLSLRGLTCTTTESIAPAAGGYE